MGAVARLLTSRRLNIFARQVCSLGCGSLRDQQPPLLYPIRITLRHTECAYYLMTPFDYQPRTRIVFGPGRIETLGELASELGARRALVVSDPGVIAAGHTAKGIAALERAGIETHLFDGVHENPTTDNVADGAKLARRYDPEVLIGLGGGSSMDCCKGINFVFSNGGEMKDYWGVGKALKAMLPMIAVPTTAGTGSETQSFALISESKTDG